MKRTKLLFFSALSIATIGMFAIPSITADATEVSSIENVGNQELSQEQIDKLDKYVSMDEEGQFIVSEDAKTELSNENFELLNGKVTEANQFNESVVTDENSSMYTDQADKSVVVQEDSEENEVSPQANYKNGKNAVQTYWWGTRIWISKNSATSISGGLTVANVYIPSKVVQGAVAAAGFTLANVPGGFVFNVSTVITPGGALPSATVPWGFEWQ